MLVFRKSAIFRLVQFLFIFLAVCLYSGAFTDHVVFGEGYGEDLSNAPKIINSLLKFPLYFVSFYFIVKNYSDFKLSVVDVKWFFYFCLFCLFGSMYSTLFSDSLFKLFSLFMTFVVAFGLAKIFSYENSEKYLSQSIILLMVSSIVYIYFFPELGLMSASDDFEYSGLVGERQGVFKHKNVFGAVSAFGFLYAFYFLKRSSFYRNLILLTSFSCLVLANSATKIFGLIVILIFVKFVKFTSNVLSERFYKLSIFFSLLISIFILAAAVNVVEDAIGLAGKDLTFTGRTVIWAHALDVAKDRWLLGYGLSSIWSTDLGYIPELPYYIPIHSHNSFIETILTSGFVGIIFLLSFIFSCFNKYSSSNVEARYSDFFLSIFMLALIDSFFEYTLFRGNSVLFMLSMFSLFLLRFQDKAIDRKK